ncbi:YdeI/OmpD-associated family protein [Sunxiuqinia sp. A32]|uniref:YdeI/OmpD-associated family protein n=1 Tax=Sunxiuqinia sp. A32 TaxID=3461496 RepID=UPI00404649CB
MKIKKYQYKTTLFAAERGGIYAGFPYTGKKEFGTNGPVRIKCWIDGFYKEGSLVPMGGGDHAIHVRKEIRDAIGKVEGDEVWVVLEQDFSPKELKVPEDFQWLLDEDTELKSNFEKLSFTNQSVIVNHINEAKRPETRVKRIENMLARIRIGFYPGQKLE